MYELDLKIDWNAHEHAGMSDPNPYPELIVATSSSLQLLVCAVATVVLCILAIVGSIAAG